MIPEIQRERRAKKYEIGEGRNGKDRELQDFTEKQELFGNRLMRKTSLSIEERERARERGRWRR